MSLQLKRPPAGSAAHRWRQLTTSAANHDWKKAFFRLTEQEFTFLGTITLVLLCQPKTIKPRKEIQHNNIFKLRGKNTLTDIIMYYWPQKEKPSRITIINDFSKCSQTKLLPKNDEKKGWETTFPVLISNDLWYWQHVVTSKLSNFITKTIAAVAKLMFSCYDTAETSRWAVNAEQRVNRSESVRVRRRKTNEDATACTTWQ